MTGRPTFNLSVMDVAVNEIHDGWHGYLRRRHQSPMMYEYKQSDGGKATLQPRDNPPAEDVLFLYESGWICGASHDKATHAQSPIEDPDWRRGQKDGRDMLSAARRQEAERLGMKVRE